MISISHFTTGQAAEENPLTLPIRLGQDHMMRDSNVTFENRYIRKSRRECTLSQSSGSCPTFSGATLSSIARAATQRER